MTGQLQLLDGAPPSQSHSDTSRDAAEAIAPHISEQQRRILDALRAMGPMTDEEIQRATGLAANSERPRRIELWKRGRVSAVGKAKTRSGRSANTWDVVL